jgi:malate dehydrogenase (oxaloacetate-decarboxylating)(NADP+)
MRRPKPEKRGFDILLDRTLNKSLGFDRDERKKLGISGLLPYTHSGIREQVQRVMVNLRRRNENLEKYMLLSGLQETNEQLFFRTVIDNVEELMPIIYTPTVGDACKEFSNIFNHPKGFYITPEDKGEIAEMIDNWPEDEVKVVVVTDGQRILGLGDLGANGMGISIGKLALYTACAGINPDHCMPVAIDSGTDNEELLNDILYLGYPSKRIESETYFELVEEFIMTMQEKHPGVLIQFEDFLTPNAFELLRRYRDRVLCFNDDIQGTAAVILSGVYSSCRITKKQFKDLTILFLGAGSASTGIGDLMVSAFVAEGLSEEEARKKLWFVDLGGLVVKSRTDLQEHNLPYAHDFERTDFLGAIKALKPDVLIGATGAPGTFSQAVIEAMSAVNERPVIFALSNPTSKAECTAEQAYTWSKGKAVFASGSPFPPFELNGQNFVPRQGNNAYIFPGLGLGLIIAQAKNVPDELFLTAAYRLADLVEEHDLEVGGLYPPIAEIRDLSMEIAIAVVEKSYELGIAQAERPTDLRRAIENYMYNPKY